MFCPNVHSLEVAHVFAARYPRESLRWFDNGPWGCPLLENLNLVRLTLMCHQGRDLQFFDDYDDYYHTKAVRVVI